MGLIREPNGVDFVVNSRRLTKEEEKKLSEAIKANKLKRGKESTSRHKTKHRLDVEIDKLTRSIENAISGDTLPTDVIRATKADQKEVSKKRGWLFDWRLEFRHVERTMYKLTIKDNPKIIQGLMSMEDKRDHIFIHLIESAKFNRGKEKLYLGVPANLVAYACRISFERGYEGFVAFDAKSVLIQHYKETLGATHHRGVKMFVETNVARKLITQYFGEEL
jgi:hypothetical protein